MVASTEPVSRSKTLTHRRDILRALEIDVRILGMIAALLMIFLAFGLQTDGRFVTPRNIFNITVQTVSVAIMATGMVFIIVMRHIDLSVGSVLATCSAVMAMTQSEWLINGVDLGQLAFAIGGFDVDLGA